MYEKIFGDVHKTNHKYNRKSFRCEYVPTDLLTYSKISNIMDKGLFTRMRNKVQKRRTRLLEL